jgi:hypothetical protein
VVAGYIDRRFQGRWIFPAQESLRRLPATLNALGVAGGASYDALVAITAIDNEVALRTLDTRAERVYRLIGAEIEYVR